MDMVIVMMRTPRYKNHSCQYRKHHHYHRYSISGECYRRRYMSRRWRSRYLI